MREETSAEDVGGMHAAEAVVTAHGGMTSHAAVVARGWGKPCICGCEVLRVDTAAKTAVVVAMPGGGGEGSSTAASYGESSGGAESHTKPHAAAGLKTVTLKEGDFVSVNGTTGDHPPLSVSVGRRRKSDIRKEN